MINFSDFSIQPLVSFFHAYPYSSGIIAFFIMFLETTPAGAILPGAIMLPAIGFLIGSNAVPPGSTFLCAIIGAISGDYVGYFIGIYFQNRIHRMWPFSKRPKLLEQGEKYFRAHGGKSVFIGRFVLLVRVVIPMIAGMLKMPVIRFSLAAIPSATIWAACYIMPGVLLGALSLELPPRVAAKFTLYVFLTIIVVWLMVWLTQHFFKQGWKAFDYYVMQIWGYCQKHRATMWFTEILSDPKRPNNHGQLFLFIAAVFTFVLFFFVLFQVLTHGILTKLDRPIYYLLSGLRLPNLDHLAVIITLMGDSIVLAFASGLFLVWLLWKRYWYIAVHWFGVMALSAIAVGGAKLLLYLPRPGEVLYEKYASSFPSAHTALSLAFYGFLAVIIARESKKQDKSLSYLIAGVVVTLIALSRLYLGVHWLTDIVGSFLVGLVIVLLATISYRRRLHLHFSVQKITLTAIGIFVFVWFVCSTIIFHKQVKEYALIWPKTMVAFKQMPTVAPLYRLNRLGDAIEALNVEWVGDIEAIKQSLLDQGWKIQPTKIISINIIKGLFDSSAIYHLPIFPQLYHNKPSVLLLTKDLDQDNAILVLQLWESDISLSDMDSPLWVGTVKYYCPDSKLLSFERFRHKSKFIGATESFAKALKDFKVENKVYSQKQQPLKMIDLHWNGKLLVIQPKIKK
jgi:membrane protein DedA with SNARE-associated domain/membrane-associated phospholipid phosphatase